MFDGCGGGTSGKVTAFCLGRAGSNPRMDLGFFSSELLSITGCRAFSINV